MNPQTVKASKDFFMAVCQFCNGSASRKKLPNEMQAPIFTSGAAEVAC